MFHDFPRNKHVACLGKSDVTCWWAGNSKILMLAACYVNICSIQIIELYFQIWAFSKRWRDHQRLSVTTGGCLVTHFHQVACSQHMPCRVERSSFPKLRCTGSISLHGCQSGWWVMMGYIITISALNNKKGKQIHKFSAKIRDFLAEEVEPNWLKSRNWTLSTAFWMRFFMAPLQYNRCLFVRLNIVSNFCLSLLTLNLCFTNFEPNGWRIFHVGLCETSHAFINVFCICIDVLHDSADDKETHRISLQELGEKLLKAINPQTGCSVISRE